MATYRLEINADCGVFITANNLAVAKRIAERLTREWMRDSNYAPTENGVFSGNWILQDARGIVVASGAVEIAVKDGVPT